MYVLIIVLSVYTHNDNRFQKRSSNRSDKRSCVRSDTQFIHVNYIAKMLADLAFHIYYLWKHLVPGNTSHTVALSIYPRGKIVLKAMCVVEFQSRFVRKKRG